MMQPLQALRGGSEEAELEERGLPEMRRKQVLIKHISCPPTASWFLSYVNRRFRLESSVAPDIETGRRCALTGRGQSGIKASVAPGLNRT